MTCASGPRTAPVTRPAPMPKACRTIAEQLALAKMGLTDEDEDEDQTSLRLPLSRCLLPLSNGSNGQSRPYRRTRMERQEWRSLRWFRPGEATPLAFGAGADTPTVEPDTETPA